MHLPKKLGAPGNTYQEDLVAASPCEQMPALGSDEQSVARDVEASFGDATFMFFGKENDVDATPARSDLVLCYKFATEPFAMYENVMLAVFVPSIDSVSTNVAVRDVQKTIIFTGTLGATKDDKVKWVKKSAEKSCSDTSDHDSQGGQDPVSPVPMITDLSKKSVNVLFSAADPGGYAWALCYKFGSGPYVYFESSRVAVSPTPNSDLTLMIGHLENITSLSSESLVVVTDDTLRYKVRGAGISDRDRAKFVGAEETNCGSDAANTGDTASADGVLVLAGPAPVIDSVFAMRFSQPADDIRLCYSFRGEPFVLYRDIEVLPQQSQVEDYYDSQRNFDGQFTLVLNGNIEDIPAGSEARALYISVFLADLVRALGLADPSRISILSITSGSIIITFSIASPTDDAAMLILAQIQALLEAQLANPDSPLLAGEVTENIDVNRSVPLVAVLSEAPARAPVPGADPTDLDQVIAPPSTGLDPLQPGYDAAAAAVYYAAVEAQAIARARRDNLLSITVSDFRQAGSFRFLERTYSVAEAAGQIGLTIYRDQGSQGQVDVGYRCVDDSASGGGVDYTNASGVLRFQPGQKSADIELAIFNDNVTEAHFEKFVVEIVHITVVVENFNKDLDGEMPVAGMGSPFKAEVLIYDFGDANVFGLAETSFDRGGGGDAAYLKGWSVTGNGASNPAWIDPDGLYSVDQSFSGPSSESERVPTQSKNSSDESGGKNADGTVSTSSFNHCINGNYPGGGDSSRSSSSGGGGSSDSSNSFTSSDASAGLVFSKSAKGSVTSGTIDNFPQSEVTVSMWVRSMDITTGGTLFSFVRNTGVPPPSLNGSSAYSGRSSDSLLAERYQELAIHDARNLRVTLRDYLSSEQDALDHAHLSERDRRIVTGVGQLNDGSWHFLSVVWKNTDASLRVYVDARLAFQIVVPGVPMNNINNNNNNAEVDGGDSFLLSSSGVIAVGAAVRGDCAAFVYPISPRGVCGLVRGSGFMGSVQGVHVWGVALTEKQRELEMQWPFAIVKPNALDELRLYWRFGGGKTVGPGGSALLNNATATVIRNFAPSYRAGGNIRLIPGPEDDLSPTDGLIMREVEGSYSVSGSAREVGDNGGDTELETGMGLADLPDEAPCVEDVEWFFSAPDAFLGDIRSIYDGSLEFLMNVAQSSGVARDFQGFVEIRSRVANNTERTVLKYTMPRFTQTSTIDGGTWTHYVVVMREDFGWTSAQGQPLSPRDMLVALSNVEELLIRGDTTVCGADGSGIEVVYLQNVTMRMPR